MILLLALVLQDRVRIELEEVPDRTVAITKSQQEESHLTDQRGAGPVQRHDSSASSNHVYEETVLTVDKGVVTKVRRRYSKAEEAFTSGPQKSSRNTDFAGKTVTLTRDGANTTVEGAEVCAKDRVQLRLHDDPILMSMPRTEIVPTARWAVDAKILAGHMGAQLGGFSVQRASGSTEFVNWQHEGGLRCAVLETSTRIEAVDGRGLTLTLTNRIRHWYSPERKSMIRIDGDGRQEIAGTVAAPSGSFTFGGHSTTVYRETRAFQ